MPTKIKHINRTFTKFAIRDSGLYKKKLLAFGERENHFCFLDNNNYDFDSSVECLVGVGVKRSIVSGINSIKEIDDFISHINDYIFCHISYDLKNKIENLKSDHFDPIGVPDYFFFQPQIVFRLNKEEVEIGMLNGQDANNIFEAINSISIPSGFDESVILRARFSKKEYISTVNSLLEHIKLGDCYEVCFCQEFFAENFTINPIRVYEKLTSFSPMPFAAFYKFDKNYLLCASPERFLKKIANRIFSQPIKGTAQRHAHNKLADEKERESLKNSAKEQSENIMIVDLVRNDLSKISCEGSVHVSEYLNVYSFPQVHQLISTIEGTLRTDVSFSEIIKATFPMGSMTGAPKKKSMELIEKYERSKRGLYSGSVGYISPEKNFDLNVVIRSLIYNSETGYLSIHAGSAITHLSKAENEFEECMVKMQAMVSAIS
ncbi:MAG: anthranilate synthase component I family protein [Ginsengibacter sp.]